MISSQINRVLYKQTKLNATHTIILICCMHGNETAGFYGLQRVINYIKKKRIHLNCNFYAVCGNISAAKKNVRFITKDLNRIWTNSHIQHLNNHTNFKHSEDLEQLELLRCIKTILDAHPGTFIFADIHTTSSITTPFITISDSLNNRKLASNFGVPTVLGIEEYLDGPLLTYMNEFGHTALGFEAGQHSDISSVDNCEAFVWLMISKMNFVDKSLIPFHQFKKRFERYKTLKDFYEINFRYGIENSKEFKMCNGFTNFEIISKGQILATHKAETIKAIKKGRIFLPLYQNQGEDGFFIISRISESWLGLSSILRKLRLSILLKLLPGVQQDPNNKYVLVVNPKIAKFFVIKLFHLFGYRKKIMKEGRFYFIRRDRTVTPLA